MSIIDALPNLPPAIARHTLYILTESLPPPLTDLPEERTARDDSAIAAVAELAPANAFEARLAVRIVAADANGMDCLRLASLPGQQPDAVRRCRAQASTMFRTSEAALRSLRTMRAERAKAAAASAPIDVSEPQSATPVAAKSPARDIAAEADEYALHHRKRATLIRRLRRLPERVDCGPLKPELVQAIITGTSPILRSLDRPASKLALAA